MNFELRQKLERVAGRIRSLRFWSGLALCWLAWAAVGVVLFQLAGPMGWNAAAIASTIPALAAISAIVWGFVVFRSARDQRAVARRIESKHPELATLLLVAIEQAALPRTPGKGPGYLQATVIREALEHGRKHNWTDAVSAWKLRWARLAQFAALGLLIAVCAGLAGRAGAVAGSASPLLPRVGDAGDEFQVEVDPGNAEIERGTSLLVVAQFTGAVPPEASLVVEDTASSAAEGDILNDSSERATLSMVRSLDDPKFVGRVPSVSDDLTYHVEFAGRKSETFRVKVFDYPELVRADAKLEFPKYTSLSPTVVEDVRHVTAVEGTRLTLLCRLNKEVAEARLVDADDDAIALKQDAADKQLYSASWTLAESRRFKLKLTDREGRGSRLPAEIVINVTPNRPPKIVFERPGRDVDVSPLEELELKAAVTDEFGVERIGVSYALGGDEPREVAIAESDVAIIGEGGAAVVVAAEPLVAPAAKQRTLDYLLDFESLKVEPDQLVSYFVWAEDFGPDGKLRRSYSDMYFAEVRSFEEIFRQGEQPSESDQQQRNQQQQGGGAGQQASELAELQKEIINATWKLVRRETGSKPTAEFPADSRLVEESQQSAIEQLAELAQQVQDSESRSFVEETEKHMSRALDQLSAAADGPAIAPLQSALAAEQAAYQALLKLRAREFEVTRGARQQGGGGGGGNRSQRQLDQLELAADENRYETERRANAPQENQAQRESREILNRLRDLARRQDDLNERLRELQSALQQAETQKRREELERELKRLREQQQEILRDTDELMSRMDRAENQQATQQAREQIEEGRAHVQQASEALQEGQLSQALTEGTRAGRQLSDVRDQFRQQSANRFSEDMSEMRREARDLDEEQQRLDQQLSQQNAEAGRSLRDTGDRAEAREGLADQRRELGELLERMRQTIQEAEQPEPLLARQLYDTVREAHHHRVENALDVTQQLLDVGIEREAGDAMRAANEGIRNLRQGVERAAESVLGDEAEALRRAQREVEQLADELNREIEESRGGEQGGALGEPPVPEATGGEGLNPQEEGRRPGQQRQDGEGEQGQRGEQPEQRGEGGRLSGQPGERERQDQSENGRGDQTENADDNDSQQDQEGEGRGTGQQSDNGGQGGSSEQGRQRDGGDGEPGENTRGRRGGDDGREGRGLVERFLDGEFEGAAGGPGGPITGDSFREWSDRIGDVEEMLDDPQLRSEAARIRDRAADARADFKRHSKTPDWKKLQDMVAEPLNELSRRIGEEIRLRESPDSLVPIDRDPVPPEFSEQVRRYYERLGSGE